jgi:antitoxin Phd
MATWQARDAKTQLNEVIERARTEGPQMITWHGKERAVVLSIEDYRVLAAHRPDFKSYLLGGPKVDDFTIERDQDSETIAGIEESLAQARRGEFTSDAEIGALWKRHGPS